MTTPSHERALAVILSAHEGPCFCADQSYPLPECTNHCRDAVSRYAAALHAHGLAERRAGIEMAARYVELPLKPSFIYDMDELTALAEEIRALALPGDDHE